MIVAVSASMVAAVNWRLLEHHFHILDCRAEVTVFFLVRKCDHVMNLSVGSKITTLSETFLTDVACIRLIARVSSDVDLESA